MRHFTNKHFFPNRKSEPPRGDRALALDHADVPELLQLLPLRLLQQRHAVQRPPGLVESVLVFVLPVVSQLRQHLFHSFIQFPHWLIFPVIRVHDWRVVK